MMILLALLGNAYIYAGLAFVSGRLLPSLFTPVYASTSDFVRLCVMVVLVAAPSNYIFTWVFRLGGPAMAGMTMLACNVLVLVANAILLGEGNLNSRTLMAVMVTMGGAMWVVYELKAGV
jgi:hypothetical protein